MGHPLWVTQCPLFPITRGEGTGSYGPIRTNQLEGPPPRRSAALQPQLLVNMHRTEKSIHTHTKGKQSVE